jgi:hypothetical protein
MEKTISTLKRKMVLPLEMFKMKYTIYPTYFCHVLERSKVSDEIIAENR